MTIKSKLVPFFAAGALVSSFAALAQTANPDTGSSAAINPGCRLVRDRPGTRDAVGLPHRDSTSPTGATTSAAPSSPDQSSTGSASTPGASGDRTVSSPPAQGSGSMDSSSTGMSPDAGSDSVSVHRSVNQAI